MAPESIIDSTYTAKSDVWSYGVVLWEIFSFGATPYSGLCNFQVIDFIVCGNRLAAPETCSPLLRTIMIDCFQVNPDLRPSFTELHAMLQTISIDMRHCSELRAKIAGQLGAREPSRFTRISQSRSSRKRARVNLNQETILLAGSDRGFQV